MISIFFSPWRRMPSSADLRLRVLVGNPALIGLDLPLIALISITRREKVLTYTQKIDTKAKLERLRSIRLIHHDPKATKRNMQGFK
jgi:hypothetical protein